MMSYSAINFQLKIRKKYSDLFIFEAYRDPWYEHQSW